MAGRNISGIGAQGTTILVSANSAGNGTNLGMYRSTDDDVSFQNISGLNKLLNGTVFDLAGDPGDPDRFYAAGAGAGIFRTDDATAPTGLNWTNLTDGAIAAVIGDSTTNIEFAVHNNGVARTNAVYVGILNNGQLRGFFRSDDMGATWTAMDLPQLLGRIFAVGAASNATSIVITSTAHGRTNNEQPQVRISWCHGMSRLRTAPSQRCGGVRRFAEKDGTMTNRS